MLFHFSENPSIKVFKPLVEQSIKEMPPVVWAIDEEHSYKYFFPRDCPRVIFSKSENLREGDEKLFFSQTVATTIIVVETAWLERIRNTTIYKYTFDSDGFELFDHNAGYYINHSTVQPLSVEPIGDLLGNIISKGIELRFTPNLFPLRDEIIASTIDDFSMIRMRNAKKR
jgi:hypothetical protein